MFNDFNDPFKKIREDQERLRKSLVNPFKQIIEEQKRLAKQLENPVRKIIEDQQRFRESLVSPFKQVIEQQKLISNMMKNITDSIKRTSDDIEKFKLLMLKFGFPPHYDIELQEMRGIAQQYNENDEDSTIEKIEELLLNTFNNEKISDIFAVWEKIEWLSNRILILGEATSNHLDEKFFSSIATLLPQIEGLIVERTNHTGWLKQEKLKELLESILDDKGVFSFDENIQLFYANFVLESFQHGKVFNSPLSRHAILHGVDVGYGYKINSIRCFMLFDYLVHRFQENIK